MIFSLLMMKWMVPQLYCRSVQSYKILIIYLFQASPGWSKHPQFDIFTFDFMYGISNGAQKDVKGGKDGYGLGITETEPKFVCIAIYLFQAQVGR